MSWSPRASFGKPQPAFTEPSFTYVVKGNGEFPHDMLRRDRAQAATAADQALIDMPVGDPHRKPARYVTLKGHERPTTGRWESFGWRVLTEQEAAQERIRRKKRERAEQAEREAEYSKEALF